MIVLGVPFQSLYTFIESKLLISSLFTTQINVSKKNSQCQIQYSWYTHESLFRSTKTTPLIVKKNGGTNNKSSQTKESKKIKIQPKVNLATYGYKKSTQSFKRTTG
jgi:hypothetical protein